MQTTQTCPACGLEFAFDADWLAGEEVICPDCGANFAYDPDAPESY